MSLLVLREVNSMAKVRSLVSGKAGSESSPSGPQLSVLVRHSTWLYLFFPASVNLWNDLEIAIVCVLAILFSKNVKCKSIISHQQVNKLDFYCLYSMIHHSITPNECSLIPLHYDPICKTYHTVLGNYLLTKGPAIHSPQRGS